MFVYEDWRRSPPSEVPLLPNGNRTPVTHASLAQFCSLRAQYILQEVRQRPSPPSFSRLLQCSGILIMAALTSCPLLPFCVVATRSR